jgi:hypothetical protein
MELNKENSITMLHKQNWKCLEVYNSLIKNLILMLLSSFQKTLQFFMCINFMWFKTHEEHHTQSNIHPLNQASTLLYFEVLYIITSMLSYLTNSPCNNPHISVCVF